MQIRKTQVLFDESSLASSIYSLSVFSFRRQATIQATGLHPDDEITFEVLHLKAGTPDELCGCFLKAGSLPKVQAFEPLRCIECDEEVGGIYSTLVRLTAINPIVILNAPQNTILRARYDGPGQGLSYVWAELETNTANLLPGQSGCLPQCFVPEPDEDCVSCFGIRADFTHLETESVVSFTDISTPSEGETIVQWDWDFGDGTSSTAQNPNHSYPVAGSWNVTLTVTDSAGCRAQFAHIVDAGETPHDCTGGLALFYSDTTNGLDVTFTDASIASAGAALSTWQWDFGDGGTSTQQNPTHTFTVYGNHQVSLTVTDSLGCTYTTTQNVEIPEPGCEGISAVFGLTKTGEMTASVSASSSTPSSGGTIVSYTWDWGDSSANSTGVNQTHTYSTAGTYTITLTVVDDRGCSATTARTVSAAVNCATLTAAFTTTLAKDNVTADASGSHTPAPNTIVSYDWDWGDGTPNGSGVSATHEYPGPSASYTITLTVTDSRGCTAQASTTVVVGGDCEGIQAVLSLTQEGLTVNASGAGSINPSGGSINEYEFNWGDGSSPTVGVNPSATHTYTTPGVYIVTLTVRDTLLDCEASTAKVSNAVDPCSMFNASFTQTVDSTNSQKVYFNNTSTPGISGYIPSFLWTFGDGSTSTLENPTHTYTTSGSRTVTLSVTWGSGVSTCQDSATQTINVTNACINFEANFTSTPDPSNPLKVDFTNASTGAPPGVTRGWSWTFGDGGTASSRDPTHTYATPGSYVVTLTMTWESAASGLYCTKTVTKTVTVVGLPCTVVANFTYSVKGHEVTFNNLTTPLPLGTHTYMWDFGDGNTSTAVSPVHVYSGLGPYTVSLTATTRPGCFSTKTTTPSTHVTPECDPKTFGFITNTPPTDLSVGFLEVMASGGNTTDCPINGGAVTWTWEWGDGAVSSGKTASHTYTTSGTYQVKLTVEDACGCKFNQTRLYTVALGGPVPSPDFASTTRVAVGDTSKVGQPGRAQVHLVLKPDGTAEVLRMTSSGGTSTIPAGNWYSPTTSAIGANYQVKTGTPFDENRSPASPPFGTFHGATSWTSLASNVTIRADLQAILDSVDYDYDGKAPVEIREVGGVVVSNFNFEWVLSVVRLIT